MRYVKGLQNYFEVYQFYENYKVVHKKPFNGELPIFSSKMYKQVVDCNASGLLQMSVYFVVSSKES